MNANACKGRNGTYGCSLDADHDGRHYTAFLSAGRGRVATWRDAYGPVLFRACSHPGGHIDARDRMTCGECGEVVAVNR